jgi:hypothetical protein
MRGASHRLSWILGLLAAAVLGALAWAAYSPIDPASKEKLYEIPKGTWARRMAGEKLEVLPSEIRLMIGVKDVLVLQNNDDVPQLFGPVLIMPGQSFQLPFRQPSRYQFACTLHTSGQLEVIVDPMPAAGWERLRWRAESLARAGV